MKTMIYDDKKTIGNKIGTVIEVFKLLIICFFVAPIDYLLLKIDCCDENEKN